MSECVKCGRSATESFRIIGSPYVMPSCGRDCSIRWIRDFSVNIRHDGFELLSLEDYTAYCAMEAL